MPKLLIFGKAFGLRSGAYRCRGNKSVAAKAAELQATKVDLLRFTAVNANYLIPHSPQYFNAHGYRQAFQGLWSTRLSPRHSLTYILSS
jgi:hypothetical protein